MIRIDSGIGDTELTVKGCGGRNHDSYLLDVSLVGWASIKHSGTRHAEQATNEMSSGAMGLN